MPGPGIESAAEGRDATDSSAPRLAVLPWIASVAPVDPVRRPLIGQIVGRAAAGRGYRAAQAATAGGRRRRRRICRGWRRRAVIQWRSHRSAQRATTADVIGTIIINNLQITEEDVDIVVVGVPEVVIIGNRILNTNLIVIPAGIIYHIA